MPEITVVQIALVTVAVVIGILIGWIMRGNRSVQEKETLNLHWQDEIEAQRMEHGRLQGQNKSLMEQVSQFQASQKDATNRAKELSGALKEAFARRDELQREIKDVRNALQATVGERDKLQVNVSSASAHDKTLSKALQEKDDKIFKLSRELDNWQDRLPPLMERFQKRDDEANQLQAELTEARTRIDALESMLGSDQTRVDPVDADALADALEASNDPVDPVEAIDPIDPIDPINDADELLSADALLDETDDAVEDEAEMQVESEIEDDDRAEDEADDPEIAEAEVESEIDDDDQAEGEADDPEITEAEAEAEAEEHTFNDSVNDFDAIGSRDDLKQIKGVGPAIEKTLNELGIFTLDQIAEMSEYDIDRVAKRLKGFRTRIYREDWIGQARSLQDEQSSESA